MRIAVIPGDGIGPEVISAAVSALDVLDSMFGLGTELTTFDWGADKWIAEGVGLPAGALQMLQRDFDYILFGALGDPRIPDMAHGREILLGMRRGLSLRVNYRPLYMPDHTIDLYRENTQGEYVGVGGRIESSGLVDVAIDQCIYTRDAVTRFLAYSLADAVAKGRHTATLVHKANAIPNTGALWQDVFWTEIGKHPSLHGTEEYVDSFCYNLIDDPRRYEAVVLPNLFGDIAADLGAFLVGGMGMVPSASISPETGFGLFEPVHGSAPDIVGTGTANPFAATMCVVLLLKHAGRSDAATALRECLELCAASPAATPDLGGQGTTQSFIDAVLAQLTERSDDTPQHRAAER
jgi:isocitrate/isopropylmalate dehydrogenase